MRVAMFTEVFLPKVDGITNRVSNTVRELKRQGHEVAIFAPQGSVPEWEGVPVLRFGGVNFRPYPGVKLMWPSLAILWHLIKFRPDVVHVVGPVSLGLWGALSAKLLGVTVIASYHTDFPSYIQHYKLRWMRPIVWWLIRRIHCLADLNLCPSTVTKYQLIKHGLDRVQLWRGGVDTSLFHPNQDSEAFRYSSVKLPGTKWTGVFVGRLGEEKNLLSLRPLLEAYPEIHLMLVGAGPQEERLRDVFAGLNVSFLGVLRGRRLAQSFASADFFVMPSVTETLGFATLEAMSSGLPVLAADAGGTRDIVRHLQTGLLYRPNSARDLIAAARAMIEDENRRQTMAAAARLYAEHSSWPAETRQLVLRYESAVVKRKLFSQMGVSLDSLVAKPPQ